VAERAVTAVAVAATLVLLWDVFLAGHIAQLRTVPRAFAALSALCGLLVVPAVVVAVSAESILTGRAVYTIAWLWPLTLWLFTFQAALSLARRLVSPLLAGPMLAYNLLLATAATARYAMSLGDTVVDPLLAVAAAQGTALGRVLGGAWVLASPLAVQVPMLAPAYPPRWRLSRVVRATLATAAAFWSALTVAEYVPALRAVGSYRAYAGERLQERPAGDFAVGIKVFPELAGPPPALAVRGDLALVDSVGPDALMVVLEPEGTQLAALDSLARTLESFREREGALLIVSLGYGADAGDRYRQSPAAFTRQRLADVDRVARRLRPDYLLPAEEPYGRGARALGVLPVAYWQSFLTESADLAHAAFPSIRVAVAAAAYTAADSVLFAWALSPRSPLNAAGFSFHPSFRGALSLETRVAAADRWLRARPSSRKPVWVFAASGYPVAHGERSQEQAVWRALTWATSRRDVRGVVVAEAGDYGRLLGMRTPSGRTRPVATTVARALSGLREARTTQQ
jgi:hypothetical protein